MRAIEAAPTIDFVLNLAFPLLEEPEGESD